MFWSAVLAITKTQTQLFHTVNEDTMEICTQFTKITKQHNREPHALYWFWKQLQRKPDYWAGALEESLSRASV